MSGRLLLASSWLLLLGQIASGVRTLGRQQEAIPRLQPNAPQPQAAGMHLVMLNGGVGEAQEDLPPIPQEPPCEVLRAFCPECSPCLYFEENATVGPITNAKRFVREVSEELLQMGRDGSLGKVDDDQGAAGGMKLWLARQVVKLDQETAFWVGIYAHAFAFTGLIGWGTAFVSTFVIPNPAVASSGAGYATLMLGIGPWLHVLGALGNLYGAPATRFGPFIRRRVPHADAIQALLDRAKILNEQAAFRRSGPGRELDGMPAMSTGDED